MWGTIVNSIVIIIGGITGTFIGQKISKGMAETLMQGIGLAIILIGIQMALKTQSLIIVIGSLMLGGIIGETIGIEAFLERLGNRLENWAQQKQGGISKAFVTASLVYCVGAMAIMGALESGLHHNHQILYAKSLLDGITAIIFASTMGIGVAFSAIPVFLYQGGITLLANWLQGIMVDRMINEMTATGGLLILGIGLSILNIKKIKVGNLLPAIFIAAILAAF